MYLYNSTSSAYRVILLPSSDNRLLAISLGPRLSSGGESLGMRLFVYRCS